MPPRRSRGSTPQRELEEIDIPESVVISSDTDEEMDRRQTSAAATSATTFRVQPREESEPSNLPGSEREKAVVAIFGEVSDSDEDRPEEKEIEEDEPPVEIVIDEQGAQGSTTEEEDSEPERKKKDKTKDNGNQK